MKLQKLEVKGFKSFADKTTIHFNENITGIVGPNGCGKSNVVDAIRWVLGEQKTSQLRLEKMDNVLFNGTKMRKATSLAEVSLTFENTKNILSTEFQEVTITRKLYRTGESEYRINDVACRLKDIANLFVDSGIGSDSYAIIELGMVDEILQNKEQSRKKLFEQASSISKYKIRKKESLSKLKSTEENLERLQDILSEIESNLKSLESQARRAERYYQIKEEYKSVSLESIKLQVRNYKEGYNNLYQEKTKAHDTKKEHEASLNAKEALIQSHKKELLTREETLSQVQKKINALTSGLGKNENERNLLKEQISHLIQNNTQLNTQIQDSQSEILSIGNSLTLVLEEVQNLQTQYQAIEKSKLEIQDTLESNEKVFLENKSIVDNEKYEFTTIQRSVFEVDKKKSILQSQIASSTELSKTIESEYEAAYLQNEETAHAFEQISILKTKAEEALNKRLADESENSKKIEQLSATLNEKKIELNQIYRKLDSKKNEYNLLKSMIDNLEGYPDSIKFVKKNIPIFESKNLFSDIISCEDEYKVALENVINSYANYFVVDTVEEGVQTMKKLKENNAGKVGLFVLELIDKVSVKPPKIHGEYLPLLQIVKIEDKYKKLASVLFSHIYLVDNLDEISPQRMPQDDTIWVDKKGTITIDARSIHGGSTSLFDGAQVGRNRNLETLADDIKSLEKQVAIVESEHSKLTKEVDTLRGLYKQDEIHQLRVEFGKHNDNYQKNSVLIEQLKQKLAQLLDKKSQSTIARENWEKELAQIQIDHKSLEEQMEALKSRNESNEKMLETYLNTYNDIKGKYGSIEVEYNSLKNILSQKQQQVDFYTQKKSTSEQMILTLSERIQRQNKEHEEKSSILSKMELEILANYTDKEKLEAEVQTAEKEYFSSRNTITESENELKDIQATSNRHNEYLHILDTKIQEMRIELQSVKERLKIEFAIELDEFINSDLEPKMLPEEIEYKIAHLRKRLETYGEINPMAIESFNETKKRYDFLVEQKNDIVQAKNDLLETIREIDTNAKERFLESFHQIRAHFIRTFRILFTEDDDCDLILTDPENPLDSDIEIIAKPKGKKPLTINQLSGGEKTLTATALLFSLYLLKPAPFCIFDEVDAPLDDTNIAKFNNIIEEFSKNSQFIIVTHNKQTMSSVDVLYGVTMIEQGVSRVVPVDFRQLQQQVG